MPISQFMAPSLATPDDVSAAPAPQDRAAALQERLIGFAVRVLPLANQLQDTLAGRHIAGQILRSGTSAAPNYAEARSAESRADFIHKLRIAIKELNETFVWIQIIQHGSLLKPQLLDGLAEECEELQRILGASLRTARRSSLSTKR